MSCPVQIRYRYSNNDFQRLINVPRIKKIKILPCTLFCQVDLKRFTIGQHKRHFELSAQATILLASCPSNNFVGQLSKQQFCWPAAQATILLASCPSNNFVGQLPKQQFCWPAAQATILLASCPSNNFVGQLPKQQFCWPAAQATIFVGQLPKQ